VKQSRNEYITLTMTDRQNTIVCIFDVKSPRISAFNIQEWIFETLKLAEEDLYIIQIYGPRKHVYIKFKNAEQVHTVLNELEGQREYRHDNGVISKVKIEPAGMGMRTIRIANLTQEVNEKAIANILSRYGEVKDLRDEAWSKSYRYQISNGIRIATMNLKEHIPLNDISARHAVGLYWVPGHAGARGNETADRLAKSSSGQQFIGPEPFFGVSRQNIRQKLKHWMKNQHLALWRGPCRTETQALCVEV
jgi:hypothetical protein